MCRPRNNGIFRCKKLIGSAARKKTLKMMARERAKNNDSEIFSPARQDFGFKSAAESHFPGSRIHLTLFIKNRNLPNRLKKKKP